MRRPPLRLLTLGLVTATFGLGLPAAAAAPVELPQYATFGMAVNAGAPALFQRAVDNGLPVQWARLFVGGAVPSSFSDIPGATAGFHVWLSIWLDPVRLAAGDFDAALQGFAPTVPAGTRVTLLHEPSAAAKATSAAAFKAAFEHGSAVITTANPGVLVGPIDIQANVSTKHYLDGLDRRYVQFVGVDAYDGINGSAPGRSLKSVAGAALSYVKSKFRGIPVGFSEFNSSRTSGRAKWIADSLKWGRSAGAEPMVVFTSFPPYSLTDDEQKALATLITVPARR